MVQDIYIYMCVCVCVVCACARARVCGCVRVRARVYVVCVCACVCVCVGVCACVCVENSASVWSLYPLVHVLCDHTRTPLQLCHGFPNFFVAQGHTRYCGLIRGPHVGK